MRYWVFSVSPKSYPIDERLGDPDPQMTWRVTRYHDDVMPGDFDLDGDVDVADLMTWQRDPGVGDLSTWRDNFGTPASSSAGTTIPEPGSFWLALVGLLLSRRR